MFHIEPEFELMLAIVIGITIGTYVVYLGAKHHRKK
jgi:hypothetical protein